MTRASVPDRAPLMRPDVALLTGGGDRPYALGLATSLVSVGITLDFIGSDHLKAPEVCENPRVRFLNLRGDASTDASLLRKVARIVSYYWKLLKYAATAEPRIFHILWNNKLELADRTLLMAYYKLLRKRIAFTVHNVNIRKRDGNDGLVNRLTLRVQYRLVDHLFVHTEQMRRELLDDFGVRSEKISVIPFGINSTVPDTALTPAEARTRLGLSQTDKTLLFFGNIAPYKGLEFLVDAMAIVGQTLPECRLIIAGRPKGSEAYWAAIDQQITTLGLRSRVVLRIEYVPDADTELYFKAADVLVLPYTHVFQSGVLFLGYNFGLPVIVADVGSLRDDIFEGRTGFVCMARDPASLAKAIETYFASDLFATLVGRRSEIRQFARERYSWATVGSITNQVYRMLVEGRKTDGS
ncbi:MAG TPA: glycosyltransferase family 4 protein [Vicinamibacterales bacterium]|nr:glycosyltransferase family 4 protein [Vicinamibacterales bacterium]